jgi:hypothetical protein
MTSLERNFHDDQVYKDINLLVCSSQCPGVHFIPQVHHTVEFLAVIPYFSLRVPMHVHV